MFRDAFEIATLGWRFVRQASKGFPASGAFVVREYSKLMLEQMPEFRWIIPDIPIGPMNST